MPKFSDIPYFSLDDYFEESHEAIDPGDYSEVIVETEAGVVWPNWMPYKSGISLADGRAAIRVEGKSLGSFAGARIVYTDYYGKSIEGLITGADTAESLGSELLTNGDFSTSGSWFFATEGWTISGGELHLNAPDSGTYYMYQSIPVSAGVLYKVSYDITSWTSGSVYFAGLGGSAVIRNSVGSYSQYVCSPYPTGDYYVDLMSSTGVLSIDNFSIKPVINLGTDAALIGGVDREWTSIESGFWYNSYTGNTFDVLMPSTNIVDVSLVGDRHSIFVRGGYWTRLYVDIDGDYTEIKFRSNPDTWVSNRSFVFTKDPSGADFDNGSDVYFRKDSYLHDYFRTLAETDSRYKHYVNLQKPFIYFGKIYLTDADTNEYRIKHYAMRDFVINALPEHNRTDKLVEYLDLYYDRVHSEIYSMLKNMITMIDPREIDADFLDYIADMYGVTISEAVSADEWQLEESQEREFVARIIWWLKRKGTYSALFILWLLLVGRTNNLLNIYERWHDGATPGPPSFASFVDYLYISYYGFNAGRNLLKNGNMKIDDYWYDYGTPIANVQTNQYSYNDGFSRMIRVEGSDDGIESHGFTTELNRTYIASAYVRPYNCSAVKMFITKGDGTGSPISQEFTGLTENAWNNIEIEGVQSNPGSNTKLVVTSTGIGERVIGDNSDFDTLGDWEQLYGSISCVPGGNPGNCMKLLNNTGGPYSSVTAALDFASLESGKSYVLSVDIKSNGSSAWDSAMVRLYLSGTGMLAKDTYITEDWVTYQWDISVPDGWYYDTLGVRTFGDINDGDYWLVDNIRIYEEFTVGSTVYVDNVKVHEYTGAGEYYYESKGTSAYPTEYDGYGDNWTLSTHYKVEIDMTNEPFGDDYIINRSILYNLHKYWESVRPISRVSHYRELISPVADWSGQWVTLYQENYEAVFKTICLNPPLEPAVGTDFYIQSVASSFWTANHSLSSNDLIVQVYDSDDERIIAEEIYPSGSDYMIIDLYAPKTGTAYMALSTSTVQQSTPSAAWDINHGQGDDILTYFTDSSRHRIYPETVYITDSNNLQVTFSSAESGYCMTRVKDYKHTQTIPEYIWNVQHDLGVTGVISNFYTTYGEKIYPDVVKLETEDLLLASFSEPTSGYAFVCSVAEPKTSDTLWTPLTSGYIKLGDGSDTDVWNPWAVNDIKSTVWTIANQYITYVSTADKYYITFELPLSSYEGNITEVGLFNVDDELIFYSYCDPLYKLQEFGLTMHYRLEKD